MIDIPNSRTSHAAPTPRGGGIAVVVVWCAILTVGTLFGLFTKELLYTLLPGVLVVSVIGFYDDRQSINPTIRFLSHMISASLLLWIIGGWQSVSLGVGSYNLGWFGTVVAVIGIVWSINLYNFMDGVDMLASIEAIFIFTAGGFIFLDAGGRMEGMLLFILAGSVFGFLIWNLPPAKIFMGDGCSGFLGFLVGGFALIGDSRYGISLLVWVILYGTFWFDATVTLSRRYFLGQKWYLPHRSHAYQRLNQSGWSHRKVTAGTTLLNICLAIFAGIGYLFPVFIIPSFLASVILLSLVYIKIERKRSMH